MPAQEEAVKKFGSAKAISSDMYFGDQSNVSRINFRLYGMDRIIMDVLYKMTTFSLNNVEC